MSLDVPAVAPRERARPLPPDDRRAALIACVIPLLKEHGRDVSTRQIADACGVAEGTVFRAFGDKESLITAAIETYFDPLPFRTALRGIDPELPVEQKLGAVLGLLRDRFAGVIGFMTALRMSDGPPPAVRTGGQEWLEVLRDLLAPNAAELAVPVETVGAYLRLVAMAAAVPQFNASHEFGTDDLLALVAHGVLASGRDGACSAGS
jgi:AcrR family transcriptional regulator